MSISICGWVEFNYQHFDWQALINIEHLIEINTRHDHDTASSLFGARRFGKEPALEFKPVFEEVEFPEDASREVKIESGAFTLNTYTGEPLPNSYFGGFTCCCVSWPEIKNINWDETSGKGTKRRDYLSWNWQTLFQLMETLSERYHPKNVRLIVWFIIMISNSFLRIA